MTAKLHVKGWSDFQHYKDRSPPWIKLHKGLLDNYEYQMLPLASRALAPMLWLLASESEDGSIDASPDRLAFRLRTSRKEIDEGLKSLIQAGFLIPDQIASDLLAVRKRDACLEGETEVETEKEKEVETELLPDPVFLSIPLTSKQFHAITESKVNYYREHYPAVDVEQEIRKMVVWCDANPAKRKTKRGIEAFIASWLSRAQDSAGQRTSASATPRIAQPRPMESFRERDERQARKTYEAITGKPHPDNVREAGQVIDVTPGVPFLEHGQ